MRVLLRKLSNILSLPDNIEQYNLLLGFCLIKSLPKIRNIKK